MNAWWANGERFVNGERERTVNAERKTVNDERTMSARWTHGERTVSERKNGKVERFRDCNLFLLTSDLFCYVFLFEKGIFQY